MHLDQWCILGHFLGMAVNPDTTVRKIFSLPKDAAEAVENFRFEHRFKTEAEAIRRLVEVGLTAHRLDDTIATLSARAFALSATDDLPEHVEEELGVIVDALDELRESLKGR
ncbi:MAG: hypothetical protein HQL42_04050 [Alphaproteobacteria bacterium]|nr:hypothetical protein [Alphaproteobacteria bacterium]